MTKAYIISTTTALALGYTAALAQGGITAKAAVPLTKMHQPSVILGEAAQTTLESFVDQRLCAPVNTELEAVVCSAGGTVKVVSFFWETINGEQRVRMTPAPIPIDGTWSPGDPQ